MSDSQLGAFRNLRVLWFPFSIPATLIGAAASVLSAFGIWVLQPGSGDRAVVGVACRQLEILLSGVFAGQLHFDGRSEWLLLGQMTWLILIWGSFGLAMARCMVLRLSRDEYISTKEALLFGFQNAGTALLFPVITIGCLLALSVINGLIGLLMQLPGLGVVFYLLLPLAWICAALAMLVGLTALLGSGLVLAAIAAEKQGTLDAWGKALNYVFARPIQFIIYIILTKIFVVDFIFGLGVAQEIPHRWVNQSLTRFFSGESMERIQQGGDNLSGLESFQRTLLTGMDSVMTYGITGLALASAAGAFVAMFLILRQDVDGIDPADIS